MSLQMAAMLGGCIALCFAAQQRLSSLVAAGLMLGGAALVLELVSNRGDRFAVVLHALPAGVALFHCVVYVSRRTLPNPVEPVENGSPRV